MTGVQTCALPIYNMLMLLIRYGCGALIALVLGSILITIVDKILKEKTEE